MAQTERNETKRREISETGKMATLSGLFEGTGFKNEEVLTLPDTIGGEKALWSSVQKSHLEGIDFDLVYTPLKHLGYKIVLSAAGPLLAKGFSPYSISVNMGLSKRFFHEDVDNIWTGIVAAAKEHKIEKISLDLNPSMTGLAISISAQGYRLDKSGVVPEMTKTDLICITGNLGAAYMGLHVLEREKAAFTGNEEKQPDLAPYKFLLAEYLSPQIRREMFDVMAKENIIPSSGYFITKGLADILKRIEDEKGFCSRIYLEKIPIAQQTFRMAEEINMDAITAALNGGDDYKFLFTFPVTMHEKIARELPDFDIIGHLCEKGSGNYLVTPEGSALEIKAQGW